MTSRRDRHLPSPEIVDWLLSLFWSVEHAEVTIEYPREVSTQGPTREATFAIGRDEYAQVLLPTEALRLLRRRPMHWGLSCRRSGLSGGWGSGRGRRHDPRPLGGSR